VSVWGREERSSHCAITSITLLEVKLDRTDNAHLHEQVAMQIRRAIAEGEAKPGERIPPARHIAAVLGVNSNTILRALRVLRDEGLLEMAPRRGIRVVGTPADSEVRTKIAELLQLARRSGYTRAEVIQMLSSASQ
jgi:GntR family transcriptional regulator